MDSDRRLPWPIAGRVVVPAKDLPATVREQIPEITIPAYMFRFAPDPAATIVTAPDGRQVVAFAHAWAAVLCLDPSNGQVVDMVLEPKDGSVIRGPVLVNSTLNLFTDTVHEAIRRFPFYSDEADMDETQAAADSLRNHLRAIDPPAWLVDGHWDTFYWDVGMGDFAPSFFEPPRDFTDPQS